MKTKKWKIDPIHSEVQFSVKHLMITKVTGRFKQFDATLEAADDDLTHAKAHFTAEVASIETGMVDRDKHLHSDDFFNAEKYPQIKFASTSIDKVGEGRFKLKGDMTIRDITRPIELDVTYNGQMKDFYNNVKAGFEINGKIKRKEFGLKWDAVTEAGGVVVSDEIQLHLNVQMQLVSGEEPTTTAEAKATA